MNQSEIHKKVMRRVHTVHALRPLTTTTALSMLALLLAVWGIGRQVWVAQVFNNMPSDATAAARFMLAAFTHTEFVVQALIVLALLAALWLVSDAVKNLRHLSRFA